MALNEAAPKPDATDTPDSPQMLVWHFKDKNYSYLSRFYPENTKCVRLADDTLRQVTLSPKDKFAIGRDSAPYELQAALNGQSFEDIYVIDPKTDTRKLALAKQRNVYTPSLVSGYFLRMAWKSQYINTKRAFSPKSI